MKLCFASHSPSSFSSKTGLFEELLAPILFFHLPQWNIDAQIAFLASRRETKAVRWTPSPNDSPKQTSWPKLRVRSFALFIRCLFFRWRARAAGLKVFQKNKQKKKPGRGTQKQCGGKNSSLWSGVRFVADSAQVCLSRFAKPETLSRLPGKSVLDFPLQTGSWLPCTK